MSQFVFPIDVKSLYFGVNNDNEKGHTATVSTNLKQQGTTKPELALFCASPSNIDFSNLPGLVDQCLKNSKSESRVNNVLVFDRIFVNGKPIECDSQFCLYLKEETDSSKYQCGRIKLHYPIGLFYEDAHYSISNRKVIVAIQKALFGYAFIVRAFELGSKGAINLIVSIIGQNGVAYSKVFLDYKGNADQKFTDVFNEQADTYDYEILTMKKHSIPGIDSLNPTNYSQALKYEKALAKKACLQELLVTYPNADIYDLSNDYPYSIYDFEVRLGLTTRYVIVEFTSTNLSYFYLSDLKMDLLNCFPDTCEVCLVKNVLNKNVIVERYSLNDLQSIKRRVAMVKYEKS